MEPKQPTEKRNPQQPPFPGQQQPQRSPGQKPQHEQERERKES
jgi:hypothetical protein